jgi:selenocysteine lyase/cysteine desulfurase
MLSTLAPRSDFPLLAANPGLPYLDSAATSQKPALVLDAIRGFYETANANPHRGAYALSAKATDLYHDARSTVARFVGVSDSDCVIFTRGTTEAMNLVASSWGRANVGAGDEIVITALEHHANFVPWQQLALATGATLRIVELTPQQTIDLELGDSVVVGGSPLPGPAGKSDSLVIGGSGSLAGSSAGEVSMGTGITGGEAGPSPWAPRRS